MLRYALSFDCVDLKVLGKGDLRVLLRWLKTLKEYKKVGSVFEVL